MGHLTIPKPAWCIFLIEAKAKYLDPDRIDEEVAL
jgi:hypothetical protein